MREPQDCARVPTGRVEGACNSSTEWETADGWLQSQRVDAIFGDMVLFLVTKGFHNADIILH